MNNRWKPNVTVAAVIERDGHFLLVEEQAADGLRLNNPAGHLDPGEDLIAGCVRETLEETAHPFTPEALVGVYLSRQRQGNDDTTYLRFAFCGTLGEQDRNRPLDLGIVRTLWMTPDEIRATTPRHRSPIVLQCVEDYLRGQRFPLALIHVHPSVTASLDCSQ